MFTVSTLRKAVLLSLYGSAALAALAPNAFAQSAAGASETPMQTVNVVGSRRAQLARRVCRVADVPRPGSFISEPRRSAAGRRDGGAGRGSGMAAVAGQNGDTVDEQQPPGRALHARRARHR
mgnify:CR=1 FL=1